MTPIETYLASHFHQSNVIVEGLLHKVRMYEHLNEKDNTKIIFQINELTNA